MWKHYDNFTRIINWCWVNHRCWESYRRAASRVSTISSQNKTINLHIAHANIHSQNNDDDSFFISLPIVPNTKIYFGRAGQKSLYKTTSELFIAKLCFIISEPDFTSIWVNCSAENLYDKVTRVNNFLTSSLIFLD